MPKGEGRAYQSSARPSSFLGMIHYDWQSIFLALSPLLLPHAFHAADMALVMGG
jgi:hypothetical protein